MRIVNDTDWNTEHLRAITSRVAREWVPVKVRKRAVVTFRYSKRGQITGEAWVGGRHATIRLPSAKRCAEKSRSVDLVMLASCIAHEMAHLEGVKDERSMRSNASPFGSGEGARKAFAWAADMKLEPKGKRGRPVLTPEQRINREMARTDLGIARWELRQKRAATALTKYRHRRRYYEKRLAALKNKEKTDGRIEDIERDADLEATA